jgi:hypothetical protein
MIQTFCFICQISVESTDLTTSVIPACSLTGSKVIIKLVELLFGRGGTILTFHHISLFLKKNEVNISEALCLNEKNVPML